MLFDNGDGITCCLTRTGVEAAARQLQSGIKKGRITALLFGAMNLGLEVVHGVGRPACEQGFLAKEVFLVIVANIRTGQILVFHRSLIAANFLTLNVAAIGEHTQIAEIAFRQNIYAQRRFVIGRQGDEMMDDTEQNSS